MNNDDEIALPTRNLKLANLARGARDTFPMLLGAAPFGMIFGTLVSASPMMPWHGQLMSLSVYAGSSQFIATGLIASHTGMLVIWLTTFIVNLRHMLYAATLLPHVAHLSSRWRWLLGFLLTDETFAVVAGHHQQPLSASERRYAHWYFLGSGLAMYSNWQVWTLIGLLFGTLFPGLQNMGLDYAMVATFIAIIVPQLHRLPYFAAALAAGSFAYFLRDLPYKLGLLTAVFVGVVVGIALSRQALQKKEPA